MEIADGFGNSLSCLSLLCFSLQAESFSLVSDSTWTQRPHRFCLWLPGAMLLEHASGSAAGVHADLGKAQALEVGCESAGFALGLPRKPAVVLAFSSCADLGKLLQFSEPRVSDQSTGCTYQTGDCEAEKGRCRESTWPGTWQI